MDPSGVALARLVLEVGVEDDLGQTVTTGMSDKLFLADRAVKALTMSRLCLVLGIYTGD